MQAISEVTILSRFERFYIMSSVKKCALTFDYTLSMHKFRLIVIIAAFLFTGFQSDAALAGGSPSGPIAGPDGLVRYPYGKMQPTLICRPLYICDVELQADETVLAIDLGDSAGWIVASGGQSGPNGSIPHVFVKPTQLGLNTDLVITTTERTYFLRLVSSSDMAHPYIGYYDPEGQALVAEAAPAHRTQKSSELPHIPARRLDYNYKIQGDKELMPQKVYNDGADTFIEYSALPKNLPVLFTIALDGSNQMENFRLRKSTFIVNGIPSGVDLVLNAGMGKHGQDERHLSIRHK
jgi:P-type conjugative transfer protein TrbG